jgi:hypothetical protein
MRLRRQQEKLCVSSPAIQTLTILLGLIRAKLTCQGSLWSIEGTTPLHGAAQV